MKVLFVTLLQTLSIIGLGQSKRLSSEWSLNAFRNPSVGVEYRHNRISGHLGYYPTAFKAGVNTNFIRTGISWWFLPFGKPQHLSMCYMSISYARGLSQEYKGKDAVLQEVGIRWSPWSRINFRLGVVALWAQGRSLKVNPTPGISYSFPTNRQK